jgi:hypothetical protein
MYLYITISLREFAHQHLAIMLPHRPNARRGLQKKTAEVKNKPTQPLTEAERGARVELSAKRVPRFGTLRDIVQMTPEQFREATRPMTEEEADAFAKGR